VEFVNGDKLSGTVKAVSDGKLSFRLDLADETAEFPIHNLSELTFAGPPDQPAQRSDVIYLRDGSYLSASVTGLSGDAVEAVTPFGQAITVPKEKIAGIGFYRPDDVLFQSDFSSKAAMGLTAVLGSWDVETGRLVQESPIAFCRAYVRVVQAGAVRYEWTMNLSRSSIGGICFYAARCDTRFGDSAYMVTIRGKQAYLYKIIGEARHQGKREQIKSSQSLVRFKVQYDPRTGDIVLWADDNILMRLNDPRPLQHAEYVLLHTEGRAVFDDLKITHLVGGIEGIAASAGLDTVFLSNGDRISGEVRAISGDVVLRNSYTTTETLIPRDKVRSIVFASSDPDVAADEAAILPEISFWNGDVVFGHIAALDDQTVALATSFAPELILARSNLRAITFPLRPASAWRAPNPAERFLIVDCGDENPVKQIEDVDKQIVIVEEETQQEEGQDEEEQENQQ